MDVAAVEYLIYLKKNAALLRKEAQQFGFTEDEINQCIEEALKESDDNEELANSPKNKARKCFHYFRVAAKVFLAILGVIFALWVGVMVLTTYHKPSEHLLGSVLQPYGYQIFRTIRLVTLPVHNMFNITEFYDTECIIENPFYEEEHLIDCNVCSSYTNVKLTNASTFTPNKFSAFANTMKPVLIKGTLPKNLTYDDLRQMYLRDRELLTESVYQLHSSETDIRTLDHLFLEDKEAYINATEGLHIDWEGHTVGFSVALRSLFPRPKFVPEMSEISIEKHVIIDGPNKSTYLLPRLSNTVNMYMQGSGARKVLLRPRGPCLSSCKSLVAIMNAGDALMFHFELWDGYVVTNGDQSSIGYLMSVGL